MTSPPDRADLVRRIDRFLAGLERAHRQPNRRERYHIADALEQLEAGALAEAEAALLKAQHAAPLPAHVSGLLETNQPVETALLRAALQRIAGG